MHVACNLCNNQGNGTHVLGQMQTYPNSSKASDIFIISIFVPFSVTNGPPSLPLQIVAAILAIAGIVMMTYADGFHSHSVIGITLVVASASMSALYKVYGCI